MAGHWLGVTSPHRPRFDGDLRPPYRLSMWVQQGPEEYVGTRITVHADAATRPALGPKDADRALWHAGTLVARVHCEGTRFRADALTTRR